MYWNSGTSVIDKQISNRLTLTWDVLKLITSSALTITDWWLTLTWDVLKLCGKQQLNWHIYD